MFYLCLILRSTPSGQNKIGQRSKRHFSRFGFIPLTLAFSERLFTIVVISIVYFYFPTFNQTHLKAMKIPKRFTLNHDSWFETHKLTLFTYEVCSQFDFLQYFYCSFTTIRKFWLFYYFKVQVLQRLWISNFKNKPISILIKII